MLEILQFYVSSFPTWLGISIGIYVVAEAAVKVVSIYKDK
jgi:hypothetical protein